MKPLIHLFRKTSLLFAIATLLALPALHQQLAFAQETGQISGSVTDPSGAALPNATVTVRNMGTNAVRTTTTGGGGTFVVTGLQPAVYEVVIKAAGFQSFTQRVEVTVASKVTVDSRLSVAGEISTVEVTAEGGAQANTQTQELSQIINSTQVSQMPSLTRNAYDFVALAGNVSAGDSTNSGDSRGVSGGTSGNQQNAANRGVGFNINGQRSSGTEILLDGVENISVFTDGIGVYVPIDATQEFRVQTSNYEPQYGRASGGIVNVTTKSGTNAFHGNVWEFNRLSAYTSNTVLNAQGGQPKGKYTRNQFGFAVGGPVLKDKLFFFGSSEWTRVRSSGIAFAGVPTPQFLALSAANTQAFFSTYGGKNFNFTKTYTADQLGIKGIPATTPAFGVVAYTAAVNAGGSVPQNTYNIVGRADYNLSDSTRLFFRYADYEETDLSGAGFASPYSQYNIGAASRARAYLLSATHIFNPALASSTKISFSRFNAPITYDTKLQNSPTLFIGNIANAQLPGTSTFFQLPGFYDFNPGTGGLPFGGPQNTIQINQDVNIQKGRHSMQFGGQILYLQANNSYGAYAQANELAGTNVKTGLQNLVTGDLFQFSAAVDPGGALPCVRNPYTGALTQTPACTINLPARQPVFARSNRFHDWAVYAQDSFRLTPRFTVNYGVRYEYYGVQHNNKRNLESNFYYGSGGNLFQNIRTGQVFTTPNSPNGRLWNPQYGTVSPRVGFAYDIFGTGKTAIRGGYGISYERNFGNVTFNVIQNPPNYAVVVVNGVKITTSNSGPLGGATGTRPLPPTSLRHVDQNIRTAQTQFWDAALEQQLARNTVVSLQYAGARGLHLYDIKNINALGSGNVLLGDPVKDPVSGNSKLTRLNSQYGNTNNRGSNGDSYYEAMNLQFQSTNFHNTGLSLIANYTLAHQMDDLSTTFSENNNSFSLGYLQPFNPGFDRGNGDLDIRHRLVIAPIYRTPFYAKGHSWMAQALGSWQVTGIYTVRTGTPFTYFDSTNNNSGYQIARYTPAAGIVPQHTFKSIPSGLKSDKNSYVIGNLPAANSFGNPALPGAACGCFVSDWGPFPSTMVARNSFRGPGAWTFDASVSKTFPIHEQINVEFRAEGFDLLNHHNLFIQQSLNDAANVDPGAPLPITASKGGIGNNSGANDERRFGQFALKINF